MTEGLYTGRYRKSHKERHSEVRNHIFDHAKVFGYHYMVYEVDVGYPHQVPRITTSYPASRCECHCDASNEGEEYELIRSVLVYPAQPTVHGLDRVQRLPVIRPWHKLEKIDLQGWIMLFESSAFEYTVLEKGEAFLSLLLLFHRVMPCGRLDGSMSAPISE